MFETSHCTDQTRQHGALGVKLIVKYFKMSTTYLQDQLSSRGIALVVVESAVVGLVFVFGAVGNILVFCATWRNHHLRTISNMFIVGLAVSDILMSIICMPLSLMTLIHSRWMYNSFVCHLHGFSVFTLGLASLHMMALVSINRYFCILKTSKYPRLFSKKRTLLYICLVWANAFIGTLPPFFFGVGGYSFQPGKAMCLYEFEANIPFTAFIEVVYIGLPLSLIAFCYASVFKAVYRNNRVFAANGASPDTLRANVKETKVTKTLAVVFLGFASCWTPVSVIDYIDAINGKPVLARQVYLMYGFLVYISSMINPIIYGITSRSFRNEYKKMFKKIFCEILCCNKFMSSSSFTTDTNCNTFQPAVETNTNTQQKEQQETESN